MTATKAQRRTLAVRSSMGEAIKSAAYWRIVLGEVAEVRVEEAGPGTTPANPFAVTANKTRAS